MEPAMQLYSLAMQTALMLSLPVTVTVAGIGVAASLIQTVVGIQDQNISFGPKLAAAALVLIAGGPAALATLTRLLDVAVATLPLLTG